MRKLVAAVSLCVFSVLAFGQSAPKNLAGTQNAVYRASTTGLRSDQLGIVDVSAALARVNQRVSEVSEETEAAIARYPATFSPLPFGGPMFVISPRFPWGESIPMPRISVPRTTYTTPAGVR